MPGRVAWREFVRAVTRSWLVRISGTGDDGVRRKSPAGFGADVILHAWGVLEPRRRGLKRSERLQVWKARQAALGGDAKGEARDNTAAAGSAGSVRSGSDAGATTAATAAGSVPVRSQRLESHEPPVALVSRLMSVGRERDTCRRAGGSGGAALVLWR